MSNRLLFHDRSDIANTHYPLVDGPRRRDPGVGEVFREHALHLWHALTSDQR